MSILLTGMGADSSVFTPLSFGAALVGWWDASNAASIASAASLVSQWNDLSGQNNHATQATGALKPTLVANGITFIPANENRFSLATALPTNLTVFAALSRNGAASLAIILSSLTTQQFIGYNMGGNQMLVRGTNDDGISPGCTTNTNKCCMVAYANSTTFTARHDRAQVGTGSATAGMSTTLNCIGERVALAQKSDMTLNELFVLNTGTPSGTQISQGESYLSTKWGTP